MIYSDKQYRISRNVLDDLISALAVTETQASGEEWIKDMEVEGLKSQIAEIEADVSHYQQLKTGNICHMQSFSLSALPTMLIEARIATGMSQSDLARVLGIKPQQVQRYEATNYMSASLARLVDVAEILNINISSMYFSETGNNGAVYSWNNLDDIAWHKFPAHEMVKRGWFDIPRGANLVDRVKDYVLDAVGPQIVTALHRKKMRADTLPDEYGLLAWQARVLERAQNIIDDTQLPRFNHDDRWLSELVMLTRLADGPRCAARLLASNGIILVTEKHLTGTYLDGAAMVSASDHPVIGMTLRHDRLDNFWFVLFHELGHVYLHLYDGLRYDFFDDDGSHTRDSIELEADRFALSRLVPDDQWGECLSRFALSEEAVHLDASKLGIDASIIAGRIRKELGNYRILNQLVGLRKVRIQFKEESHDIEQ